MKSVKFKLFFAFSIVIFIILAALSFFSIRLFWINENNENLTSLDTLNKQASQFVSKNFDERIERFDQYINERNKIIIILKNNIILFSNQTNYKTKKILEDLYESREFRNEHHHRHQRSKRSFFKMTKKGYIKADDYIFSYNKIIQRHSKYEVFVGLDEDMLSKHNDDILYLILFLNTIIFFIISIFVYILINKTIKPLRQILNEVKTLENGSDLSKRLKPLDTKDEFEDLIKHFNTMMDNIENSVENIKQFSSNASHEFKTPLTVIQGEIELCKNSGQSKEELEKSLEKIDNEQKKLQDIIKNFLLLSRLEKDTYKNSQSQLDKVIFDVIEYNLLAIENKNLELKLDVDVDEDLTVNFEEKYLNIVINNLFTNAIKYTNEGFIKIKAYSDLNKQTVFEIQDSGIGLSKEQVNKIFERFYRVDEARTNFQDGIGLGLSIVEKICSKFKTKIEVKSEQNKGTIFKLLFK